ncbi:hypothetical protein H0H92_008964, partial [Tricholoma furcatifolium]
PLAPPYIDPPPPEVHEEPEWMALSVRIPVSPIAHICNLLRDYRYLVRSIGEYNQVIDSFCIVPWPLSLQDQIRLSRDLISALIFDYGGMIAWRFCSGLIHGLERNGPSIPTAEVHDTRYRHICWDDSWLAYQERRPVRPPIFYHE